MAKQWIRMYYTAGSYQYLFVMLVWGINRFTNLYSPQLIPVFLHERFCSTMRVAQLLNVTIKNSESYGSLELERQCKLWYLLTNHESLENPARFYNSFSSSHLICIEFISLLLRNKFVQCEIQVILFSL